MKKLIWILAIFTAVAVIVSLALNYFNNNLNSESRDFVDTTFRKIITDWDSNLLIANSSPSMLAMLPKEKLKASFNALGKDLGALKKYRGASGQVGINFEENKQVVTATYDVACAFEKTEAVFRLQLIREAGKWQIKAISVNKK
ncbi:hypothetical protein A2276_06445 [candidate division WOR-1 bacterium RIFOXYA12_FULL_43_27]|uniref:DUF4878 domain-containing protein n=1 Tax=candidate division WOR-1 bacterium RIFOXYC2_FULL_46_14 TaxID=1802587 RepID=A0A1F4U5C1_UNCSA|nr:MAG: hypothetical protein A2276_06445 [candidate division WOR-1 bacterium RIFOXYA12_FULL_43_27]OGC20290.1 MAG: hypothetical protein A2292_04445 [candidate division WOR-1 bacterium RIFOXYB2_FULL_46_45]OGC31973.1 MAG: hypothetical protein A2232_07005 [candidate division WOR-1 bacterium RIFOXYA2_FULL_46_56]OGC40136.1 MAG: hypothetical protein A2438_02465 [candidate division WOR-1 bacterium RIFOXYC2_FULL_46_14]